jgi:putative nucleotidyltransferase with HDIG domain
MALSIQPINVKREKTQLVLMNIYNLPPIPKVISEALRLFENNNTNVSEINRVISKDQSLVSKILLVANSPFYGLQRKVTSVEFAILILGFAEIKNIISVLSLIEAFKNKSDVYLNQKTFFLHSFLTGTLTKNIAENLGFPNSSEAFVAGFLHDIGISIIHKFFHSNFIAICDLVQTANISYNEAELEILGMTHAQIGNFLVDRWNFPETICDGILNHHNPENSKNSQVLSSIIHLADYMTQVLEMGSFSWDNNLSFTSNSKLIFGFKNDDELTKYIDNFKNSIKQQIESVSNIV